jgi:hypothetical protein
VDGVFTVHHLATPVEPTAELRRDLLLEALAAAPTGHGRTGSLAPELDRMLDDDLFESWQGAVEILEGIRPDVVLVVDYRNLGALRAVEDSDIEAPIALVALGADLDGLASGHFHRLIEGSTVLVVTRSEEMAFRTQYPKAAVHRIGIPAAANASALREPNAWVENTDYILVVTGAPTEGVEEAITLSRLLRLRFPDHPVGIASTDAFNVWHRGRLSSRWPIERTSDMSRLVACARVTVDLDPGPLVARRCVDSLLYGTPIVVPSRSRAREHAELGGGGLWFSDPGQLVWCVEAMLDPDTRDAFGSQGRAYAERSFGSTDAFIDGVLAATGLPAR